MLMRYASQVLVFALASYSISFAQDAGQYFDSGGVRVHYSDQGAGEPVVLIHGLNGNYASSWFDSGIAQRLLDAGYRVLALDARAHGLSGTPHDPGQYGPEMALDVARLLEHVDLERAHIVGYSMGAIIAGKLREMRSDLFISLTLGGWGWNREDGPTATQVQLADSLERGSGFMPLYQELYPDWTEEAREARSAEMVANLPDVLATVALLRGFRLSVSEESLRSNSVPTLAIIGENDPRKVHVDAMQGVMQKLQTVVIPGADHAAARTHPMFINTVLGFLAENSFNR